MDHQDNHHGRGGGGGGGLDRFWFGHYPPKLSFEIILILILEFLKRSTKFKKIYLISYFLKGLGTEPVFLCLCISRFGIGFLHYLSSRSDFGSITNIYAKSKPKPKPMPNRFLQKHRIDRFIAMSL